MIFKIGRKFSIFGILIVLMLSMASSATWVLDPNSCPEIFESQQGVPGTKLCGYDGQSAYFYDMTTLVAPSGTTTFTGSSGGLQGGFGLDCEAMSATEPFCVNSATCNYDSACSSVGRLTECSDWGVSSCGTCGPGYQSCDGSYTDGDGCEVETGVTSRGTNVVYGPSCSYQCSSGYLDCNGDATGSDGACEIQVGVTSFSTPNTVYETCTTGVCESGWMACEGDSPTADGCNTQIGSDCTTGDGKPGTWQSGCSCEELAQEHFITNTEAKGWGDFLLWGRQYNPTGWLMNLTSFSGDTIGIDNESCIVFSDGTTQCSAGGSSEGSVNESVLNETISTEITNYNSSVAQWHYNQTLPAINYADSNFLRNDGDNATGRYMFDGNWDAGGVVIDSGDVFAQRLYVYNITSLAVNNLNVNGSLVPDSFDGTFDIGSPSFRWRNGYFSDDVYIGGESVNDKLNLVNFSGANNEVLINDGVGGTKSSSSFLFDTSTNVLEVNDGANSFEASSQQLSFNSGNLMLVENSGFTPQYGNFVTGSFKASYDTGNTIAMQLLASENVDSSNLDIYLSDSGDVNHLYYNMHGVHLSGYNTSAWDDDYLITKGYADSNYGGGSDLQATLDAGNTASSPMQVSYGAGAGPGYVSTDFIIDADNIIIEAELNDGANSRISRIDYKGEGLLFDYVDQADSSNNKTAYFSLNGFTYASDYSTDFINRSLVDKEYVDLAVLGAGTDTSNLVPYTGATQSVDLGYYNLASGNFYAGVNSMYIGSSTNPNLNNSDVVAMGYGATSLNLGSDVNALGNGAAESNSGSYVNAFGRSAGELNSGSFVNFLGRNSGENNVADHVNAIGEYAARDNTGSNLNAFGRYAAYNNSVFFVNAMGEYAARDNTGSNLNAFGRYTAERNSGLAVNALGFQSAYNNSGDNVNAMDSQSAYENTGGNVNAFGSGAGYQNVGNDASFMGDSAGSRNSGNDVLFLGRDAGYNNSGSNSIGLGYRAGYQNVGENSIFIGYDIGFENNISNRLMIDVENTQTPLIDGDFANDLLVVNGLLRGDNLYAEGINVYLGVDAGLDNSNNQVTLIGSSAGNNNSGHSLVAVGSMAGNQNTGSASVMVGNYAGNGNSVDDVALFGYNSGWNNGGYGTAAFGTYSGSQNIGGYLSALGHNAGNSNEGDSVISIGKTSGNSNVGNFSMFIGDSAGSSNSGDFALGVGFEALRNNQGNNVIAIGNRSGYSSTASDSIYIGNNVGEDNAVSDRLIIDNTNTTTPLIDGDFAADNLTVNGNLIVTENIDVGGCIRYNGGTLGNCI